MKNYIVAYDIFNKKRLKKVKDIVYLYKLSGQKSALEIPLNRTNMKSLIKNLLDIVEDEDKVNIIKVSESILLGKATQISYENNGVIIL